MKLKIITIVLGLLLIGCTAEKIEEHGISIQNFSNNEQNTEQQSIINILDVGDDRTMIDPVFVSAEKFGNIEYLLLAYDSVGYYNHSGDAWFEYAFLGGQYSTWSDGRELYESINVSNPAMHQQLTEEQLEYITLLNDDISEEQIQNYKRYCFEPYLVGASADGAKHLYRRNLNYIQPILYLVQGDMGISLAYVTDNGLNYPTISSNLNYYFEQIVAEDKVTIIMDKNGWKTALAETSKGSFSSVATDNQDEYAALCRFEQDMVFVELYSLNEMKLVFQSDPLMLENGVIDIQYLDNERVILSVSSGKTYDYYQLDYHTNTLNYLFSAPSGSILSPDGKYLAYTADRNETYMLKGAYSLGYYIYNIDTQEAVYYESRILNELDDSHPIINHLSGWVPNSSIALQKKPNLNLF